MSSYVIFPPEISAAIGPLRPYLALVFGPQKALDALYVRHHSYVVYRFFILLTRGFLEYDSVPTALSPFSTMPFYSLYFDSQS